MNEWTRYHQGYYAKNVCSIRTKDGKEYGPCWPNANTFHVFFGGRIEGEDVESIRYWTDEEVNQYHNKQRESENEDS